MLFISDNSHEKFVKYYQKIFEPKEIEYNNLTIIMSFDISFFNLNVFNIIDIINKMNINDNICLITINNGYKFIIPPICLNNKDLIIKYLLSYNKSSGSFLQCDYNKLIDDIINAKINEYNLDKFQNINIVKLNF